MYKTKTNEETGKYLPELIRKKFSSQRQLCIAYLEAEDNSVIFRYSSCRSADCGTHSDLFGK